MKEIRESNLLVVPIWMLNTAEPFKDLFPVREKVLSEIIADMEANGFDAAHPIVVWNMVVVDGHTRLRAAIAAGLKNVVIASCDFADENEALEYAINAQRHRRNLTDAELLKCLRELDQRRHVGRPKKGVATLYGRSSTAVAKLLGISRSKVEKLRAINDYASDEIKEAFRQGKYTINGAYQATMEPRRRRPRCLPDVDAELLHGIIAEIHARLNALQIRKLVQMLQLEIATN